MGTHADRVLVGIVAVVLALGVVVAWIATGRGPEQFDPGTPESVTQAYLTAVFDRDAEVVADLLTDDSCSTVTQLARVYVPESARVVLVGTTVTGREAAVRIAVTQGTGGLLDGGGWTSEEVVGLVREDGVWRVDPDSWPLYGCVGW